MISFFLPLRCSSLTLGPRALSYEEKTALFSLFFDFFLIILKPLAMLPLSTQCYFFRYKRKVYLFRFEFFKTVTRFRYRLATSDNWSDTFRLRGNDRYLPLCKLSKIFISL